MCSRFTKPTDPRARRVTVESAARPTKATLRMRSAMPRHIGQQRVSNAEEAMDANFSCEGIVCTEDFAELFVGVVNEQLKKKGVGRGFYRSRTSIDESALRDETWPHVVRPFVDVGLPRAMIKPEEVTRSVVDVLIQEETDGRFSVIGRQTRQNTDIRSG
jgi:hypothetical protein